MGNRLPYISGKHKICIICEGNEEFKYLERLKELNIWSSIYDITLVNAKGNGNIPARYQDRYQNGSYEVVLVLCDTEKKPYEQYEDIKRKINEFHGVDNAADEVVIFANPCTLQIMSKHWTDEIITSSDISFIVLNNSSYAKYAISMLVAPPVGSFLLCVTSLVIISAISADISNLFVNTCRILLYDTES